MTIAIAVLLWAGVAFVAVLTYPQWGYSRGYCVFGGETYPPEEVAVARKRFGFLPGAEFRLLEPLPPMIIHPLGTALRFEVYPTPFDFGDRVGTLILPLPLDESVMRKPTD